MANRIKQSKVPKSKQIDMWVFSGYRPLTLIDDFVSIQKDLPMFKEEMLGQKFSFLVYACFPRTGCKVQEFPVSTLFHLTQDDKWKILFSDMLSFPGVDGYISSQMLISGYLALVKRITTNFELSIFNTSITEGNNSEYKQTENHILAWKKESLDRV